MSESIEVMAVLLPEGKQKVRVRVRWILREDQSDDIVFPLPEDSFLVELVEVGGGAAIASQTVVPHPYIMLDPPRSLKELAKMPDGRPYSNLLPADHANPPWKPVNPKQDDLTGGSETSTLALGVAHFLGHSSPARIHRQLVDLAANVLRSMGREGMRVGTRSAKKDELMGWAEMFATMVRRFPRHPTDLPGHVRSRLKSFGRDTAAFEVLPWVEKIWPKDQAASDRALAAMVWLLSKVGTEAARIAGNAADVRGLMGMRAGQGGELLDYWCDAKLTYWCETEPSEECKPSPVCLPERQGARVVAAEAFGLGTDFVLSSGQTGKGLKVRVTLQRPAALEKSDFYSFPLDLPFDKCKAGQYRIPKATLNNVVEEQVSSLPPPEASQFSAWVDYDLVSSFYLDKGHQLKSVDLEKMFLRAKPVTGDGQIGLRIVRRRPPTSDKDYDYAFNVYCLWEGASKEMQKYFDNPETSPPIDELRPFLVTRRYSYRRDLVDAFQDKGRIANLKLLDNPPHEALLGRPTSIDQLGTAVAYPSPSPTEQCAQLTLNLRDIFPAKDAPPEVRWEKQGGGLPAVFDPQGIWTVEKLRPGTLPDTALPQRYRLWITGVDVFGQESALVPVVGSEPPDDLGDDRTIFVPRWRSPPPAAEETTSDLVGDKLEVRWNVAPQELIGSSDAKYYRLPLKAEIVMMRRPIRDIRKPAKALLSAEQYELNTPLARSVEARGKEGWEIWKRCTANVTSRGAQQTDFALSRGDKGYEYLALISHAVPEDKDKDKEKLKFVHQDSVQRVRYLRRSTDADRKDRFDEEWWSIPAQGEGSEYRNHPRFSACAESRAVTALPGDKEFPPLDLLSFIPEFVSAKPVQGVVGVDRDQVLAKIIELKHLDNENKELGTARRLMIDTAIQRLEQPVIDSRAFEKLQNLLDNLFTKEAAESREKSHPIIGFRGAVRLKWSAKRRPDDVPVAQYRVYAARCPRTLPKDSPRAKLINGVLDLAKELVPASLTATPQFVVLHEPKVGTWTGLACRDPIDKLVKVKGLQWAEFAATTRSDPPSDKDLQVAFTAGELVTTCEGPLLLSEAQYFEVALPVGGGHPELGGWWICAADCTNKETWWDLEGKPKFFGRPLAATIAPLPPQKLEAAGAIKLLDAVKPDDYDTWREFLPKALPREGLALFPHTVVSWDEDEVKGGEQYIFIERQTQVEASAKQLAQDPVWSLLRAIQAAPVGSPWDQQYEALRPWLQGETSPAPDGDFAPDTQRFFFNLKSKVAWKLKDAAMTRNENDVPVQGTFVDYFDLPPSEGGGVQPSLGEITVRYRAFKAVDLKPDAGPPEQESRFESRFLLSGPSAWTGWVCPEWPRLTFTDTAKVTVRDDKPLVTFSVSSEYKSDKLLHMRDVTAPFFFRVALRRNVSQAFATGADPFDVLVGELLQVPLVHDPQTPKVVTQDDSLERNEPATDCEVSYSVVSEFVWKDGGANGGERVLRMFDKPHSFAAKVPALSGTAEARLDIDLTIVVGGT